MRLWMNRYGAFWYVFLREGHAPWRPHDLVTIDTAMSVLSIGEAMHATIASASPECADARRQLLREHRVTGAETAVAELVERGLTNREIATILGRSVHTVGNQLAACCRKLDVSTRTELAYVLSNAQAVLSRHASETRLSRILRALRAARSA